MTLMNPQPLTLAERLSSAGEMCFASRKDETTPPHPLHAHRVVPRAQCDPESCLRYMCGVSSHFALGAVM